MVAFESSIHEDGGGRINLHGDQGKISRIVKKPEPLGRVFPLSFSMFFLSRFCWLLTPSRAFAE